MTDKPTPESIRARIAEIDAAIALKEHRISQGWKTAPKMHFDIKKLKTERAKLLTALDLLENTPMI